MPSLTPRELTRKRWLEAHPEAARADPPRPPVTSSARPVLGRGLIEPATDGDVSAVREWSAHLDAGRIGMPALAPPAGGEYRLASLARILGHDPRRYA